MRCRSDARRCRRLSTRLHGTRSHYYFVSDGKAANSDCLSFPILRIAPAAGLFEARQRRKMTLVI